MKQKNILRISFSLFLAFVMALPAIAQNTKTFKGGKRLRDAVLLCFPSYSTFAIKKNGRS